MLVSKSAISVKVSSNIEAESTLSTVSGKKGSCGQCSIGSCLYGNNSVEAVRKPLLVGKTGYLLVGAPLLVEKG